MPGADAVGKDTSIPFLTKHPTTRGFTLVEIMIVVVIIGMLAALAVPAFQKVRNVAQDKAITNNARLLGASADQYFLQMGTGTVEFLDLVGTDKFVRSFQIVAQELYPSYYTAGVAISITNVRGGAAVITYAN